jgi:hypothetical protein
MKSVKVFTFLASLPSRSEHHGMMRAIQKAEKARQNQLLCSRDETLARNPPIGGLFDESPEHSVRMGVRGGAGRIRTVNQAVIAFSAALDPFLIIRGRGANGGDHSLITVFVC